AADPRCRQILGDGRRLHRGSLREPERHHKNDGLEALQRLLHGETRHRDRWPQHVVWIDPRSRAWGAERERRDLGLLQQRALAPTRHLSALGPGLERRADMLLVVLLLQGSHYI